MAPGAEAEAGKPVKVVLYIDFICPVCKNFEAQYNETLTTLRNEGKITVEYRPLGFLDSRSTTNYSSRAANAAACVVNESPEKYSDFVERAVRQAAGRRRRRPVRRRPEEDGHRRRRQEHRQVRGRKTYRPCVKYTTQEAPAIGVTGTPTVFVDGKQWGKGDSAQTPFRTSCRPRSTPRRNRALLTAAMARFRIPPGPGLFRILPRVWRLPPFLPAGGPWANLI